MHNGPVVVEQTLNAPVERVWDAITRREEMRQWYFDLKEFNALVGFEFRFYGGKDASNQYLHLCKVTEVTAGRRLSYTWEYDGYPGKSLVTFELIPEAAKTRIRLTHEGLEHLAVGGNPDFDWKNFEEGWRQIVGSSLVDYLHSPPKRDVDV
jgi:uncharacterized protein YndB with AHSA1/START domain